MAKLIRVPKRLAGVKIPKGIRKGPIVHFLNTPAGKVVLAQAVLLVGGGLTAAKAGDGDVVRHPLKTLRHAGRHMGSRAKDSGEKLTRAFAAASHAFRDVMESDDEDLPHSRATNEDREQDERSDVARKKSRVRSESPSTPH